MCKLYTTKMVKDLNWEKLEQRRKRSDVTLMCKVVHHLIAVPVYHHPTMAEITSTHHSHAWKFQTIRTSINVYKYSFFPRTIFFASVLIFPNLDLLPFSLCCQVFCSRAACSGQILLCSFGQILIC
jgi:uncharacterized membrane protein (GlpM family)